MSGDRLPYGACHKSNVAVHLAVAFRCIGAFDSSFDSNPSGKLTICNYFPKAGHEKGTGVIHPVPFVYGGTSGLGLAEYVVGGTGSSL